MVCLPVKKGLRAFGLRKRGEVSRPWPDVTLAVPGAEVTVLQLTREISSTGLDDRQLAGPNGAGRRRPFVGHA
jgi:hypothetical protein